MNGRIFFQAMLNVLIATCKFVASVALIVAFIYVFSYNFMVTIGFVIIFTLAICVLIEYTRLEGIEDMKRIDKVFDKLDDMNKTAMNKISNRNKGDSYENLFDKH